MADMSQVIDNSTLSPIFENTTSIDTNSSSAAGIICAAVVQYGHGFMHGDAVFNSALAYLLFQSVVVMLFSRSLGRVIYFIKEPLVIAEMIVGIILGPTVMGRIPGFSDYVFPCHSVRYLKLISSFGLVLFMFVVGVEIDIQYLRKRGKMAIISSVVSCAMCFVAAVPLMFLLHKPEYSSDTSWPAFYIFLSIIMAISALPVLARILSEYKLLSSPLGTLAIGSATVDDLIAWPMLAIVMSLAGSATWRTIIYEVIAAVSFVAALFLIVRPALKKILARATRQKHDNQAQLSHFYFFILLVVILGCAWICEVLGLTAFIGAMGVGLVIPRNNNVVPQLLQKIEDISVVIFLPLYFTVSGLRTQLGYISTGEAWGLTALLILCASLPKMTGCTICARFIAKCTWRESTAFAILLNSKGLVALVAINLGLQNGIITAKMFSMFVVLVLANTIIAAPIMHFIQSVGRSKGDRGISPSTSGSFALSPLQQTPSVIATLQSEGKLSELNILIYTADPERVPFLVTLASSFTRSSRRKCRVIFVRLLSPELRPSLIMSDVTRELLFRDDIVKAVRARATVLDLTIDVLCEFSSDPIADIASLAEQHSSPTSHSVLLTDIHKEKLYNSDYMDRLRDARISLGAVLFDSNSNGGSNRSDSSSGISSAIEHNEKILRIFPSPLFSGCYQQIVRVERILIPYFNSSDSLAAAAIDIVLLMAAELSPTPLEVDILCAIDLPVSATSALQSRFNAAGFLSHRILRTTRNPLEAVREETSRSRYSLIVIGDGPQNQWILKEKEEGVSSSSPVPILVARLPPPNVSNVNLNLDVKSV